MDIASPYPNGDASFQDVGRDDEVREAVVHKALRSLLEDAERCDGTLARADVDRVYVRRQLNIQECIRVEQSLLGQDISIIEPEEGIDAQDDPDIRVACKRVTKYLTVQEERDCGRSIAMARLLTAADETENSEFCARVRLDAQRAVDRLVESNLRWVRKVARQFRSTQHLDTDDLYQEGVTGLLKATELYDSEMGFRFKTYATWWIRQRMTRAIGDFDRTIRIPIHVQETLRKVKRTEQSLLAESGNPPTIGRVAESLGVEKERLLHFMWRLHASNTAELDAPISEDTSLIDIKIDDNAASAFDILAGSQLHQKLTDALQSLTPREERVIRLRFGMHSDLDHTLEEVGNTFGVTRERIRQIEAKALKKLRHPTRSRALEPYRVS